MSVCLCVCLCVCVCVRECVCVCVCVCVCMFTLLITLFSMGLFRSNLGTRDLCSLWGSFEVIYNSFGNIGYFL